jgi:hypothetical protein
MAHQTDLIQSQKKLFGVFCLSGILFLSAKALNHENEITLVVPSVFLLHCAVYELSFQDTYCKILYCDKHIYIHTNNYIGSKVLLQSGVLLALQ